GYLLLLVNRVGAIQASVQLAPCRVSKIIHRHVHAPSLEAGNIAKPAVYDYRDRLVAILSIDRWFLAHGIDLRLRRVARDQRGQLRLLGEEEVRVGVRGLDLAPVVDI